MRSQPPWPQVHFPRHARSQILYFLPVLCPRCWNLLVSCTRNIFWFLPASNVAQSHISGHRIRHLAGPGPGPLCSHLLSTQTCCHLTHFLFTQIAAAVTLRTAILVTASLVLIKFQFQFYYRAVISHSYREHIAIVKLAAENIRVNKIYGMFVAFNITVFEPTFITLSYMQIFITLFWFPQKEARLKSLASLTSVSFSSSTSLVSSHSLHIGLVLTSHLIFISSFLALICWSLHFSIHLSMVQRPSRSVSIG